MDPYSNEALIPTLGMHSLDYANAFPEITSAMRKLYRDRLAKFPGLPAGWWQQVDLLHGKNGKFLFPVKSNAVDNTGSGPSFLSFDGARQAWDSIVDEINKVRMAMLAKEAAKGLALTEAAYANARFWDNAYQWARVLGAPVTGLKAMWNNPWLSGILLWGGLATVAFFVFKSKSKR